MIFVSYGMTLIYIWILWQGTFKEGLHEGYVLKQLIEHERNCCELLQYDILQDFVPRYNGMVKDDEGKCKKIDLDHSVVD